MAAAGTETLPSASRRQPSYRRRVPLGRRVSRAGIPYLLILPSLLLIAIVLAYPVYKLFELSLQTYQIPQLLHESHPKAGKAPPFVGLYIVTLQVPAGAPTGAAVNVVLTIGGFQSNTVTIAVE